MNRQTQKLYLLAAAMLLASCDAGERYAAHIERRWPATGVQRVSIREVDGSVQINASNTNEITLSAQVRTRGVRPQTGKDNQGFFESTVDGDTLTIARHDSRHRRVFFPFFKSDGISVDYVLTVPASVSLDVRTVNGRIATTGINGESEITTVNGPIEVIASGENQLAAHTVNGRVRATFLSNFQGASLKTVNGGVRAILPPAASFACDLSQVNGDFEANFPLSIHSHPGSRRVSGEVNGGRFELRIATVNGDIHVENGPQVPPPAPAVAPARPEIPPLPGTATPAAPPAPPAAPAQDGTR
ncbi:MAG: DUF4097 family beta strand repeat-containing protein [Acidobacteriota bacterium]